MDLTSATPIADCYLSAAIFAIHGVNRIQVVDLHHEPLIWLLPFRKVQKTGASFAH
jgi:hypothetical protein